MATCCAWWRVLIIFLRYARFLSYFLRPEEELRWEERIIQFRITLDNCRHGLSIVDRLVAEAMAESAREPPGLRERLTLSFASRPA